MGCKVNKSCSLLKICKSIQIFLFSNTEDYSHSNIHFHGWYRWVREVAICFFGWTLDRLVRVRARAGDIVLCFWK